ncbi:MAG: sigma-70 family RNA polymerase sigma factor [Saprospiraceae bacterium]|nr:sigma-70 family RNA polymerase sigma factor [Saprospiraceae bacterium]
MVSAYEDIEKLAPSFEGYDPEQEIEHIAGGKSLDELLTKLNGQCEEVLRYRYEYELKGKVKRSISDVAKFFGFTEAYARKRISDCRAKLAKLKL